MSTETEEIMRKYSKLRQIAKVFMADKTDYQLLSDAIKRYEALLLELSEMDMEDEGLKEDLHFVNGKAIGTTWAALCVQDMIRTKKFVKGIFEAIKHLKNRQVQPIHILYAGSGPFATLILPVLAVYSEQEIQVTLIEINQRSYESVKRVLRRLNFTGFVRDIINEDATTYQIENGVEVHIVLSETMQNALQGEQQVPIMINLVQQIKNEVILIPEKIVLSLGVRESNIAADGEIIHSASQKIAEVFELSEEQIRASKVDDLREVQFPEMTIMIPKGLVQSFGQIAIFTEIQVFEDTWIMSNESGLTIPLVLADVTRLNLQELSVLLQYKISANPGFEVQFKNGELITGEK